MNLELIRTYYSEGTNGVLLHNGAVICSTIELSWKNNQPRISCIAEGTYRILKRYSPRHQWHFELKDVPGRQLILIHPANDAVHELQGCIAPVSVITGMGKGAFSRLAFKKLTSLLFPVLESGSDIFITIKNSSR